MVLQTLLARLNIYWISRYLFPSAKNSCSSASPLIAVRIRVEEEEDGLAWPGRRVVCYRAYPLLITVPSLAANSGCRRGVKMRGETAAVFAYFGAYRNSIFTATTRCNLHCGVSDPLSIRHKSVADPVPVSVPDLPCRRKVTSYSRREFRNGTEICETNAI